MTCQLSSSNKDKLLTKSNLFLINLCKWLSDYLTKPYAFLEKNPKVSTHFHTEKPGNICPATFYFVCENLTKIFVRVLTRDHLWEKVIFSKPRHFLCKTLIVSKSVEQWMFWGRSKNVIKRTQDILNQNELIFFWLKKHINPNYPKSIWQFFMSLKQYASSSYTLSEKWSRTRSTSFLNWSKGTRK